MTKELGFNNPLKKCPLCGGEAHGFYRRNDDGYIIGAYTINCDSCDISYSAIDGTEEEATKGWNERYAG